jgi:hypothetical protein
VDPLWRHRARLAVGAFLGLRFLGLIILSTAGPLGRSGVDTQRLFEIVFFLGSAAALWGAWALARGKGYSGWFGLAGLAGLLGLIVLVLLSDRAPAPPAAAPPADQPPST